MVSDGWCDDKTNNADCNFDGFDCCGSDVKTNFCKECLCLLDNYCNVSRSIIGDGFCHDEANNEFCNFDDGDCCGDCKVTDFCSKCECLGGPTIVNPLIGNRQCNDETNNAECNFDDGDCCGACISTDHCSDCVCHEEIDSEDEGSIFAGPSLDSTLDLSCEFITKILQMDENQRLIFHYYRLFGTKLSSSMGYWRYLL